LAQVLSDKLQTQVKIRKVNIGLLGHITIDDLYMNDLSGEPFVNINRATISPDILALSRGQIHFSNAQILSPTIHIRRPSPDASPNYQFVIDAFKGKEDGPSHSDLRIGSLVMRHGHITYDVLSPDTLQQQSLLRAAHNSQFDTPNALNTSHLDIDQLDLILSLRAFRPDTLNFEVRRLKFIETHSRLQIDDLQAQLLGNTSTISLTDFNLLLPHSELSLDTLHLYRSSNTRPVNTESASPFDMLADGHTTFKGSLTPSDFSALVPSLDNFNSPYPLQATLQTARNYHQATLDIDDVLKLDAHHHHNSTYINIHQLDLGKEQKQQLLNLLTTSTPDCVERLGDIAYRGSVQLTHSLVSTPSSNQPHVDLSPTAISTKGILSTDAGDININVITNHSTSPHPGNVKETNNNPSDATSITDLKAQLSTQSFDLGALTGNPDLGQTSLELQFDGVLNSNDKLPQGTLNSHISDLVYKDSHYSDIRLNAIRQNHNTNLVLHSPLAHIDATYHESDAHLQSSIHLNEFNPHALHLTSQLEGDSYTLQANVDLRGSDINTILGTVDMQSLSITTPDDTIYLNDFQLVVSQDNLQKHINIDSDFLTAHLHGHIQPDGIVDAFKNQLAYHLPSLLRHTTSNSNHFDFDLTLHDADIIHHFINTDYVLQDPLRLHGTIDAQNDTMSFDVMAPQIVQGDQLYTDTRIHCTNSNRMLSASINTRQQQSDHNTIAYQLTLDAHDDNLSTFAQWNDIRSTATNGALYATTSFTDSLGKVNTHTDIHRSQITVNDTLWQVAPSHIHFYNQRTVIQPLRIYNDEQSLLMSGAISDQLSDSMTILLNDIEIAYITDVVNFHAVRLKGQASGRATISNLYDDIHLNADLTINNMHLQEGRLGTAHIKAFWDNELQGIRVDGHINDYYKEIDRTTDISGYIAPGQNDLDLAITTHNTNAEFLNGFLSSTFSQIDGSTNGTLHVIGPLNDINLVGDISADVDMRLRATNVLYHINPQDSIHLRPYKFLFENVQLTDDIGGTATVNGALSHRNMKNFHYDFDIDMKQLTIYDENEFNSDKFYATVYADASLAIHGADGHPLRMTADVTPTRGSVFAYDAATPDAINTASFVTFRNRADILQESTSEEKSTDTNHTVPTYQGDIFMDITIHVNPNCEIKLRMDNTEDGYMSTYGSGTILAKYHNKSPFTLNGIYQIEGGRYRLYLQDIIYRDLDLQTGSNVEFNGNPFDADIHLLCHHIINSVPLQDITSGSTGFGSNNKVKVICIMDITGKLGNMNFDFDINLPNVNDETRSLVRSLISTEDEMNMQMIYLLGFGRFYSNEYARAIGDTGSDQAVNTLLSSTISGQINQMLANVIGQNSKWNIGTGLSTGEKGWDDLDVEGTLSGRLLEDRLLINGNFGYRDNALTNTANFIGDFDVKWRISKSGNTFLKAYNQTNDRYFTKTTLNTQGIGITYQRDFDHWKALFQRKRRISSPTSSNITPQPSSK